jgi:hypothetical protein
MVRIFWTRGSLGGVEVGVEFAGFTFHVPENISAANTIDADNATSTNSTRNEITNLLVLILKSLLLKLV